ncbi:MAG: NAD(P)-dependent oxidoreductase [Betaproteobacteria bacterium]|nr:NAD(P)-dependent oxidoreductase [Betaproteobacteria bacterium]
MRILITGSSGHLGEALVRTLQAGEHELVGIDIAPSPFTDVVGSIADRALVAHCMKGVDAVLHTATLHKPHIGTHARQDFIDTNVTGTLNLLEEAKAAGVGPFIFTSTTSVYGDALVPPPGAPAVWITEDVEPVAKNIYGATKLAAENLCRLFHRNEDMACLVLRTSRFFPEEDDLDSTRSEYADGNVKANEYLHRRVAVEDVVDAHLLAMARAKEIGFDRYIISGTTPFTEQDLGELRVDAPTVVSRHVPGYEAEYAKRGWKMFPRIDRVYVNSHARQKLGWQPRYDFASQLARLRAGEPVATPLAQEIGRKGYHPQRAGKAIYPFLS